MGNKFLLFASCIPVHGARRGLICDLQRNFIYPIPSALHEILSRFQGCDIEHIKQYYNNEFDEIIDEYFSFLEENQLIFYTDETGLFPRLSIEWDEPYMFLNAIVDVSEKKNFNEKFVSELSKIGCHTLQIRVFEDIPFEDVRRILDVVGNGRITSIELIIKYNDTFDLAFTTRLCQEYRRLSVITFYAAPENDIYKVSLNDFGHIILIKDNILNEKCCGIISTNSFSINIKTFTEAQHHNTCLNRKISIDTEGNIKNCPSMKESYGNIRDTTLMEALEKPGFKKCWNINKDQVEVCKDCEFRYICTDCRAYIEAPDNILSKPLKCGYNPYTCEWEEWSTNPLKQKAIEYYGMQELVKKETNQATAKPE